MTPITDLDLSIRTIMALKACRIETLEELLEYKVETLQKFRNIGKKSLIEIEAYLHEKGLKLN